VAAGEEDGLGLDRTFVVLRPHDARRAAAYRVAEARLRDVLGGLDAEIAHIGSTAIRGLVAKPILDRIGAMPGPWVPDPASTGSSTTTNGAREPLHPVDSASNTPGRSTGSCLSLYFSPRSLGVFGNDSRISR